MLTISNSAPLSVSVSGFIYALHQILTILLDSELVVVLADPSERSTVKAAARCLNASVSGPPPATANNCLSSNIEQCVFPEPEVPLAKKRWMEKIKS